MPLARYNARMTRLDALAARYEPRVRAALIRGCEAAAEAVAVGATPAVAAALVRNAFLVAVLENMYEQCGMAEARDEYDYLTAEYPRKAQAPDEVATGWVARLRRFITTEGATSIRGITETVRKKVRAVLVQAAEAGQGVAEAARTLRAEVATFSRAEAVTIVRTELITASNLGSLMGAEATGLQLDKVWLATPGARTRPTHQAANGQKVGLSQSFTVGGFAARYPGDPLLPAKERVQCRCTQTYRPRE
jgi:hypothetical protein